jgi:hypothetical protein
MIRKLLIAGAFIGMVASFMMTIGDIHRFAGRACGHDEGGGNCMAFADYYATKGMSIFAVFAVLMAALLLFSLRPSGK